MCSQNSRYYNIEKTMGSQNIGIIIQQNNGFHRIEVLKYRKNNGFHRIKVLKYRKTMGSQNGGIIIQKNNGFTEQRYYNIEK